MQSASACCLKPIEAGQKMEYPYDNVTPVFFKVDYCTGCGLEVDESVLVHDCCGLEICECEVESAWSENRTINDASDTGSKLTVV